jgi:uncharacterized protein (TIGR00725 family)
VEPPLAGRYVAVVGPSDSARAGDLERARAVGRGLAERGAVVLTGGMNGVMQAAARGASEAGGTAIGLLPGPDRAGAAPENTFTLPTGLGELRNGLLVRAADAVVAVGCSLGTLTEIALARRTGVPLVLLDGWELPADAGVLAAGPAEAVDALVGLLRGH